MTNTLDIKAKKAIIKIADTLQDISQKLDHIIKKQTEDFLAVNSNQRWAK